MPYFGSTSSKNLATCERDIQTILNEAIKFCDFSVVYGHRTVDEQQRLYDKGRVNGIITDKSKVVTYCDGTEKKSKHNYYPSKAADIIPYPEGWQADSFTWGVLIGTVLAVSDRLFIEGKITRRVTSGAYWTTLQDRPHFQI